MSDPSNASLTGASPAATLRAKLLKAIAAVVLLGAAAWAASWWLHGSGVETTDNAYVQAHVVQITPQVGGTVLAVHAEDTDQVAAGQVMVRLDPADARMALDQAEAQLAQTVREVRTLYANNATLAAQVALREADVSKAQSDLLRAQDDVTRRTPLLAAGAVAREEYHHAEAQLASTRSVLASVQSALAAAKEQATSNLALTDDTSVEEHPNVKRAAARVREAFLALKRVELIAPVKGMVARRTVQVGQRVQAGMPLMSLVTLDHVWVDANFKESQLQRIRMGQPVTLTADVYGDKVAFHGKVVGLGAGTGSAFSLLPAQNATGNWIKIVQRVPVRIALSAQELKAHPLRVGLSMDAVVDVRQQDGAPVALAAHSTEPVAVSPSSSGFDREADALVARVVSANAGAGSRAQLARSKVRSTGSAARLAKPHEMQAEPNRNAQRTASQPTPARGG
jgi:membrane fusion protein (multidrug efflux system)